VKKRTRYRVEAPLFGVTVGDLISERDLPGCNIEALVEGGFLTAVADAQPSKMSKKEPEDGA
jgi:hypothetical protein